MAFVGVRIVWLAVALAVAAVPALASAPDARQEQFTKLRKRLDAQKAEPMVFFVAKGAPNSCGEGCDTWIAAEGPFDSEAGKRLRAFLSEPGRPMLPLFFQSPGGSVSQALEIGRILRQYKMRAGVGRTIPVGCDPHGKHEEMCERIKRSGRMLSAQLRFTAANCVSACVYALLGAESREVAPDADLGVHSSVAFRVRDNGEVYEPAPGQLDRLNAVTRSYVAEMGIEPGLLDVTFDTRSENMRYLTRSEIVSFKIDSRRVIESRWALAPSGPVPAAIKSIFEVRDHGSLEDRWSYLRLTCGQSDSMKLHYVRIFSTAERETGKTVSIAGRDLLIDLPVAAGAEKTGSAEYTALVPLASLLAAAAAPSLDIKVTFSPKDSEAWSAVTAVSTAGLTAALAELRPRCR
jgi:hypothetical protein